MIHPDILAALAHERSATFLAEAEAARRARQAHPGPAAGSHRRCLRLPAALAHGLAAARPRPAHGEPDRRLTASP
jgi:hypothetical protein